MTDHYNTSGNSRLRRRAILGALAAVPIGAAVAVARSPERLLVVDDAESGERLLERPIDDGQTVVLSYTHSVEKTPVRDVYEVDDDALRMIRTEFYSFGAGLPTDNVTTTDDGYVVYLDERYEQLPVAPREIPGHELVVGDDRYDLVALADDRMIIRIGFDRFFTPPHLTTNMGFFGTTNHDGAADNGVSRRS